MPIYTWRFCWLITFNKLRQSCKTRTVVHILQKGKCGSGFRTSALGTIQDARRKCNYQCLLSGRSTPVVLCREGFTEETIERVQKAGNDKWTALLGCWLISAGCLRYRHILRASPKRISMSTAHCFCWPGKQRANRTGFYFSVPSESTLWHLARASTTRPLFRLEHFTEFNLGKRDPKSNVL